MKILVVDDEEAKCRLYAEELQDDGYEAVVAQTGAAAIELFRNENPDLVTLDIYLSGKDEGIELLRLMKEMRPGVPVVMLTAYDYKDSFAVWCADAYIVKSSDLSELKRAIRNLTRDRSSSAPGSRL